MGLMFVKYKISGGITTNFTNVNKVLNDFRDIMNGTHTATTDFDSTVADISSCEFVGSANTTIYNNVVRTNSTGSVHGQIAFNKKHHVYSTDTNYDMSRKITFSISPVAGDEPGVLTETLSGTNRRPVLDNTFNTHMTPAISTDLNDAPAFYFYISDYFFQWMYHNPIQTNCAWGGVLDFEISDHDKYVYDNVDSNYSPQTTWAGTVSDRYNTQQATNTVYDAMYIGRQNYLNVSGSIDSSPVWTTTAQEYYWGYNDITTQTYSTLFPQVQRRVHATPLATGDQSHQLIPLYCIPHSNHNTDSDPVYQRFPYIWRTTDDIGSPGQTISFGGTDYVVLMGNKCSGQGGNDILRNGNACYLLQKTIGGK
jgi:hypothetical protein